MGPGTAGGVWTSNNLRVAYGMARQLLAPSVRERDRLCVLHYDAWPGQRLNGKLLSRRGLRRRDG